MQDGFQSKEAHTYERFLLYMYLWAAEADFEVGMPEIDVIRDKMVKRGLVSAKDFDAHWHKALRDFKTHNDYESEKYIEQNIEELPLNHDARLKIFNDLQDIMMADGKEGASEKMNMFMFKKMLKL